MTKEEIYALYVPEEASKRRTEHPDEYMNLSGCNRDDIRLMNHHAGREKSLSICMEECAELIQAISKINRGETNLDNILDELSDVIISVNLIQDMLGISKEDLEERLHKKMFRNVKRIEIETK